MNSPDSTYFSVAPAGPGQGPPGDPPNPRGTAPFGGGPAPPGRSLGSAAPSVGEWRVAALSLALAHVHAGALVLVPSAAAG